MVCDLLHCRVQVSNLTFTGQSYCSVLLTVDVHHFFQTFSFFKHFMGNLCVWIVVMQMI